MRDHTGFPETVPTSPRAPADRSRATRGMVWVRTMDPQPLTPTVRRRSRTLGLGTAPREHRRRCPDSVRCKSRSRARNVRSDRRNGHSVMPGTRADGTVVKSTSFRHFFLIELSHRVPSLTALRRPQCKIARDRSWSGPRGGRIAETMLGA